MDRFVEPFAGSGVVFLNVSARAYLVADKNPDVIAAFEALKNDPDRFIERTRALFVPKNNTKAAYLALRARFNALQPGFERACLFVYLNRHGFNGLCRYNGAGQFNVSFGKYKAAPYFPETEMRAFALKAKRATFVCGDFRDVLARCEAGDIVYADPPYVPVSPTASFTAYAAGGFSMGDQAALASLARRLGARGVPVVVSNRDVPQTRDLYRGALFVSFKVRYSIAASAAAREQAPELLARFAPALPSRPKARYGSPPTNAAGAPSLLVAYGKENEKLSSIRLGIAEAFQLRRRCAAGSPERST